MDWKCLDEIPKADYVSCETLFFSVEPRVIFNTQQLLPAIKKDVLPSHHHSNVIYQLMCHWDSRYVGRTSQRLEEQIKQHVPRSIANPSASHNRQSLSRSCKANTRPQQFHESAIGQHLLDNAQCAFHYSNEKFFILARGRFLFTFLLLKRLSLNLSISFCVSKTNSSTL